MVHLCLSLGHDVKSMSHLVLISNLGLHVTLPLLSTDTFDPENILEAGSIALQRTEIDSDYKMYSIH